MILGVDISTSITGYALLDGAGKVREVISVDTRRKNKFPSVLEVAQENLKTIQYFSQFPIEKIYIEESLHRFARGSTSANTITMLSKINGIVSYLVWDTFGIKPEFLMATSARSSLDITVSSKTKEEKRKEMLQEGSSKSYAKNMSGKKIVLDAVVEKYGYKPEYTSSGNPRPQCYDEADAIVIAKAGFYEKG